MVRIFFKSTGLVRYYFLERGETINALLETILGLWISTINEQRPTSYGRYHRIIRHPPYSPDLVQSFFCFINRQSLEK